MRRAVVTWTVLALLGIVLAAGLTLATSHIVGQHIGLSSEPGSAGQRLAAPARPVTVTVTTTTTTTTPPPPSGGDDGSADD